MVSTGTDNSDKVQDGSGRENPLPERVSSGESGRRGRRVRKPVTVDDPPVLQSVQVNIRLITRIEYLNIESFTMIHFVL